MIDEFAVSYAPSASVHHLCASRRPCVARSRWSWACRIRPRPTSSTKSRRWPRCCPIPESSWARGDRKRAAALRAPEPVHPHRHPRLLPPRQPDVLRRATRRLAAEPLRPLPARPSRRAGHPQRLRHRAWRLPPAATSCWGWCEDCSTQVPRSALVTLWDVNDRSTAEFMGRFYHHLRAGSEKAWALREAMRDLREKYAHPYFWAPFVLVGKATAS